MAGTRATRDLEQELMKMTEDLQMGPVRKMQIDMHKCCLQCFENPKAKAIDLQQCETKCQNALQQFEALVNNEMQGFQNRMQRCAMECQDQMKDRLPSNPTQADVDKLRPDMETCIDKCAVKLKPLVPEMLKRLKEKATV